MEERRNESFNTGNQMRATHTRAAGWSNTCLDLVGVQLISNVSSDTVSHGGGHQQGESAQQHNATQNRGKDDDTGSWEGEQYIPADSVLMEDSTHCCLRLSVSHIRTTP